MSGPEVSADAPTSELSVTSGTSQPCRSRRWGELTLTVAALLGSICLIAMIVSLSLGIRPVVFETGSMAPSISTGSLGLSQTVPATDVRPGDVVGVTRSDGTRITHRVVSVDSVTGNSASLTLRGDANDTVDPHTYVVTEADRVSGTVPLLGYVVIWLKNPFTLALQALAVLVLLGIVFAPRQGWRNSPAGQRLLTGTAAVTVVALAASGVHGSGEAQAAPLTGTATATGTVTAGWPNDPTSFSCANVTGLLTGTVDLSWPNPPENAAYVYELSFPGTTIEPLVFTASAPQNQGRVTYRFSLGLLTTLINLLLGGGTQPVVLTNTVDGFRSENSLTQMIRYTRVLELPTGLRCVNSGTVQGQAMEEQRALTEDSEGEALETSESAEAAEPSESAEPSGTSPADTTDPDETAESDETAEPSASAQPTAPAAPELPPGGTLTQSGAYAFYQDGTQVTVRAADSSEIEYTAGYPAGSTVRWLPGTQTLSVTAPDGTVTNIEKTGDRWQETVRPPAPPEPAARPPEVPSAPAEDPAEQPG